MLARANLLEHEARQGADSIDMAEALGLLVETRWRRYEVDDEALEQAHRAVAIHERLLKSDDARLATSLTNLCRILTLKTEYETARPICERALAVAEKAPGTERMEVAESLRALADLLYWLGDYEESGRLYERALGILQKEFGADHPRVARCLWDWSETPYEMGDYKAAKDAVERAQTIQEKTLRADHPELGDTYSTMGNILWYLDDLAEATRLRERALAIAELSYGPDSLETAALLYNLAIARANYDEDYPEAHRLLTRVNGIYERVLGPDNSLLLGYGQRFLGTVLRKSGDYTEAERLFRGCLEGMERTGRLESHQGAFVLLELGKVNSAQGNHAGASLNLHRALAIMEQVHGPDHPHVAETLITLGQNHQAVGEFAQAEALFRRALRIYEKQTPDGDGVAWALTNIANALRDTGRPTEAMPLFERALAIRERTFGPAHPVVAWNLDHFAEALVLGGESAKGLALALRAEEIGRDHLSLTARALPERQALRYAAVRQTGLDLALSVAASGGDSSLAGRAWDALVRSRALVTDEMSARHRAGSEAESIEIGPYYAALAAARQRLADLVVHGPSGDRPELFRSQLDSRRREKELAEEALAEKSAAFRSERAWEDAGLKEVRSALPPRSALVAFARYMQRERKKPIDGTDRSTLTYVAFVMLAGGEPHLVRIGPATEVDSLVARWRQAIARGDSGQASKNLEADYRAAGAALRRKIWDVVAVHLGQSRSVFVVPDGTLHLVNLSALPSDGGHYLVETGPLIHYLSAERDLVSASEKGKGEGILALGGPDFDARTPFAAGVEGPAQAKAVGPAKVASRASYLGKRSACGDFQSMRFEPLPGSRREVSEVVDLWKQRNDKSPRARLIGAQATEAAFKAQAPGRQVIHLATHGFFLGGSCASALDVTRLHGDPELGQDQPVIGENPLLLSGLALAGANHRASAGPNEDDGVLTAEEVAAMDLSGVDWVVLSACDTGVGEYMAGEGIFGLRRAFQVAGARTVITSLWSVQDEATHTWMRNLYKERLEGASTAEAVRNASRRMIASLRQSGLPAHPYFWGGFVAVGGWK
ncbi:MAG TPA: CHAT domain-containing tetratricopeptide repeat protein [Candidatus Polarisedimenticolia bacterium]|nr:CHAT domain-containing tetratricopeptide repeat protein [Candidatus Polarisedimenticolia bacterium]